MKKVLIQIPEGIKYISTWKDYAVPSGKCVVDKGVTGCGYTEMCLTNNLNVILCSPRKLLLENKAEQHKDDLNILYAKNNITGVENVGDFSGRLNEHVMKCTFKELPIKIMVTYDSFHYVLDFLKSRGILERFYVIVDEMQSLFSDVFIKAGIENEFLLNLRDCPNVLYLSATPMMEKYLDQMDEFKDLPMYQLDWSISGAVEPLNIQRQRIRSLLPAAREIINDYRNGKYPILVVNGEVKESKEAVLFFNSVTDIAKLINSCSLKPEEVNILCSSTDNNRKRLRKIGHRIGKIPLKGETNKMFTLCTSTCYIGADFYSECASTYIFSDPNINSLAIDIAIDLPQIVGRQRNRSNPFRNYITLIYKTTRKGNLVPRDEFDAAQERRRQRTKSLLSLWNRLEDNGEKNVLLGKCVADIIVSAYSNDFVSIKEGSYLVPNKLVELANERAWEVVQEEYQNNISVTRMLERCTDKTISKVELMQSDREADEFLEKRFYSTGNFQKKMEAFCEFMDNYKDHPEVLNSVLRRIDPKFNNFYSLFGTDGCRALNYRELDLTQKLKHYSKSSALKVKVLEVFNIGEKYLKKTIKEMLVKIYDDLELLGKNAKATDLLEWFEVKGYQATVNHKRVSGYEILSVKEDKNN